MTNIITTLPYFGGMKSCIGGRNDNQDSCGYCETLSGLLVVVCDGMGGGPSGKLASSMAVKEILTYVNNIDPNLIGKKEEENLIVEAIKKANLAIYNHGRDNEETRGMGTTVVAMLINKEYAVVAHVGDSRCYQMRNGNIIFKTNDHSVVAELVRSGAITEEQARVSPNSNVITRALGLKEDVQVEVDILPYEKNDRFYLCSDGIWGTMPQDALKKQFYRFPNIGNILDSTAMLTDEIGTQNGGHHDNHTLLIVETKIKSKLTTKMKKRDKIIMIVLASLLAVSLLVNILAVVGRTYTFDLHKENSEMKSKIDSLMKAINDNNKIEAIEKAFNHNNGTTSEEQERDND